MNNEEQEFNFDEYYTYHRGEYRKSKTFKLTLFNLRKYFLAHNTFFILFKIFVGLIFFGLPIFLFKQLINSNNNMEMTPQTSSSYHVAGLPLIIAIVLFLIYVVIATVIKSLLLCQNRLYS